jgi:hypothetical protein
VEDGPRLGLFFVCSSCSCLSSFSIRFIFVFWLDEVSDSPRQRRGQSAGRRIVRDHPVATGGCVGFFGQSAVRVRTVRRTWPDSPRGSCGQSAPPGRTVRQWLAALLFGSIPHSLLSCFRVCFKESFQYLRLTHNLVVLAIGV